MSNVFQHTNAFIQPSTEFYGKYEVVRTDSNGLQEVIPCHNLGTARSYIQGTREHAVVNSTPSSAPVPSIQCIGFVSPSGQYYAVVEMPDMDVRIDCHNEATLRGWIRNGVTYQTLMDALKDERNIRTAGGWNA